MTHDTVERRDSALAASVTFRPSIPKARREGWLFVLFAGLLAELPLLSAEARRNWPALAFAIALLLAYAGYKLLAGPRTLVVDDLIVDREGFHAKLIFGCKIPWSRCREVRNLFLEKGGNLLGFHIEGAEAFRPRWRASRRHIFRWRSRPEWLLQIDGFEEDAAAVIDAVRRLAPASITAGLTTARRW